MDNQLLTVVYKPKFQTTELVKPLVVIRPTESDYLGAMFNEIIYDFYSSSNRTIFNNIIFRNDRKYFDTDLEATLDIDYMKDYLWKYDVEIKAGDHVNNMITIKQEIGSKFYGFVSAVGTVFEGFTDTMSALADAAVNIISYSSTTRRPHNVDS